MPNNGHYMLKYQWYSPNGMLFTPKYSSGYIPMSNILSVRCGGCCIRDAHCEKLVGGVDLNGWGCAGVHETILAWEIYCSKTNTKPTYQYGYRVRKVFGTWDPRIIWEYNFATAIVIGLLTQPKICKMGSSIFVAMSRLKVASINWASLPIIP